MVKKIPLLLLLAACLSAQTTAVETPSKSCQRFLPLTSETEKVGVPWAGFFALDTETGQLCRTTARKLDNQFDELPSCQALKSTH